jgi:recombination protein RecT
METKITIKELEVIKPRFIQVCDEQTFLKEASFALQHLSRNTYLAKATTQSLQEAVLNVAQTGLTLNPVAKMAYLVPRYMDGKVQACLEPSYIGLCKLVTDTGSVKNIYAHIVYKDDKFEYSLGTSVEVIHKPSTNKSNPVCAYAIAILHDGSKQVEVMDISEINDIKETSESYKAFKAGKVKQTTWESHFGEMARKTVIRRLVKYLPKTDRWEKVNNAVHLDEQDYKISDAQINYIDNLLSTSTIPEERKEFIERYLSTYSPLEAELLIEELKEKQRDAIDSGASYSQTEIKKKLDKFV